MSAYPKVSNGRVDPQITNLLIANVNEEYLAPKILPTVAVQETSGQLPEMKDEHFRITNPQRAVMDTSSHRIEYKISNDKSYNIGFFDLDGEVTYQLQYKLQKPFDARRDMGMVVQERLRLFRENALATAMTTAANYSAGNKITLSGADQFSDDNSTPEEVIADARTAVYNAIGREANVMVMGREVFEKLRYHPLIVGLFRGLAVPSKSAVLEAMRQFFDVDEILVGKSRKLTSAEGQTDVKGNVWGKHIALFYRPQSAGLMQPSFGYHFIHEPSPQMMVEVFENSNKTGDVVRVSEAYEDKILNFDAGYLITDAVA